MQRYYLFNSKPNVTGAKHRWQKDGLKIITTGGNLNINKNMREG